MRGNLPAARGGRRLWGPLGQRQQELACFGELGEPLCGAVTGCAVVWVGHADETAEPSLYVAAIGGHPGAKAEHLPRPPPFGGDAPPALVVGSVGVAGSGPRGERLEAG